MKRAPKVPFWLAVTLLGLAILAGMVWRDPILPDPDDCAARGKAADCWKEAPAP